MVRKVVTDATIVTYSYYFYKVYIIDFCKTLSTTKEDKEKVACLERRVFGSILSLP